MTLSINPLVDRFRSSAIGAVFDLATSLREEGREILDLSLGEPNFDTPLHVREAAKAAIDAGITRYTAVDGSSELKRAVRRKFLRDNGLDYAQGEIVVAAGAKPLLAAAIQAVATQGDEVILTTPCWPSHLGMIELAGASPVRVPTSLGAGFKMSPAQLAAALTSHTRLILLCSPSNPTGAVYSADELRAIAELLQSRPDIWILTDDLYEHVVFAPSRFATIAAVAPDLLGRTLTVNGVSKAFAMTGWRIGYAGGPPLWVDAIRKIFSQSNGGPCSISQAAAVAALDGPQEFLSDWAAIYRRRRDLALAGLANIPGMSCAVPEGAFFLLPSCANLMGKVTSSGTRIGSSIEFAEYLLEDWGVVVVPGSGFEGESYFRMSTATSDSVIANSVARIGSACHALM
jgi:aspartate aminotransferase